MAPAFLLALSILIVGYGPSLADAQTPFACPGDSCYSDCFARIPNIKDGSCYGEVESNQCQCLVAAIACARSCHCYWEEACLPDMGLWHAKHDSPCEFPCQPSVGRHGDKGDHSHSHHTTQPTGGTDFEVEDRSFGRNLEDADGSPKHKTAGGHPVAYSPEELAELIRKQTEKEAQEGSGSSSSENPRWVLPVIVSAGSFCVCCTGFIIWYIYSSNKRRKHNEMHHRGAGQQQALPGGMMQSMGPNNMGNGNVGMGGNNGNMGAGNMGNMGISNPQPMGSLPYKG